MRNRDSWIKAPVFTFTEEEAYMMWVLTATIDTPFGKADYQVWLDLDDKTKKSRWYFKRYAEIALYKFLIERINRRYRYKRMGQYVYHPPEKQKGHIPVVRHSPKRLTKVKPKKKLRP